MKNDGGPAFPGHKTEVKEGGAVIMHVADGMSLRDYIATQALNAILGRPNCAFGMAMASQFAYQYADEMLAQRLKET